MPIQQFTGASLGERSRLARLARRESLAEVAARVGRSTASVSRWERDVAQPRTDELQALAAALDVDVTWLLTGDAA